MKKTLPNPFPGFNETHIHKSGTKGLHIVIILDESSSMDSIKKQTIQGFNEFIESRKNKEKTYISLSLFNGHSVKQEYKKIDVNEIPKLNYAPGGSTNLLDAVGKTITSVNKDLEHETEENRPSVMFVIITDGEENSSLSFTKEKLKSLIQDCEDKNWSFLFLGANIDAFSEGSSFGMNSFNTASYDAQKIDKSFVATSAVIDRYYLARSAGTSTQEMYKTSSYTNTERKDIK